ncbi:hypothetical protein GCM10010520_51690 [Rhizobium viscosum]|uniref:Uncharacterized protein n=1 Tax=Rhizobium viscosum TaxID=1673 RepID=A0ABR9IZ60_RHIVS|nr:hypothetical protein [Rhizobium viscosum]MBE1508516.1 hypothetical protein [Rhizobium viscosum]
MKSSVANISVPDTAVEAAVELLAQKPRPLSPIAPPFKLAQANETKTIHVCGANKAAFSAVFPPAIWRRQIAKGR